MTRNQHLEDAQRHIRKAAYGLDGRISTATRYAVGELISAITCASRAINELEQQIQEIKKNGEQGENHV